MQLNGLILMLHFIFQYLIVSHRCNDAKMSESEDF